MRKVHDEREARAFLRAAKSARMPLKAWARAHGVDARSLNAWRVNLGRSRFETGARSTPRLVELVPTPAVSAAARYTVRIGDATVEVGDELREETLVRIVRALRSC